jgi:hypothetical protein
MRPDAGEVVSHAAAAAHGFGRLGERGVDARVALLRLGDGVAHRLHEAVDQRGAERGARRRIDAPGRHEAALLGIEEALLPLGPLRWRLDRRQRPRHAAAHLVERGLAILGVFLGQHLGADGLGRQGRAAGGGGRAGGGAGAAHGADWQKGVLARNGCRAESCEFEQCHHAPKPRERHRGFAAVDRVICAGSSSGTIAAAFHDRAVRAR